MKVTVDVDCTPEEARRFLGLPDLTPVHQAYVERMTRLAAEGLTGEQLGDLIKSWGTTGEAGLALWRRMFEQAGGRQP